VQSQVFSKVSSDRLRAFIVWTPPYTTDDRTMALEGARIVTDSRATHYWDAKSEAGTEFAKGIVLPRDAPIAYDVYFVYDGKAEWRDKPPKAVAYMHQIVDDERFLDPGKFRELIQAELKKLGK